MLAIRQAGFEVAAAGAVLEVAREQVDGGAHVLDVACGTGAAHRIGCLRFDMNIPYTHHALDNGLDVLVHEDHGCPIFNPHAYTLEEGGMKQVDRTHLAFKREADPLGLLNPGKMIAWEDPSYDFAAGKNFLFKGLAQQQHERAIAEVRAGVLERNIDWHLTQRHT